MPADTLKVETVLAETYFPRGRFSAPAPVQRASQFVDFVMNPQDVLCAALGAVGMSSKCIARTTGLSDHQITYRLKKGKIRRKDYRDGNSDFAQFVLNHAVRQVAPLLNRHLRSALRNPQLAA